MDIICNVYCDGDLRRPRWRGQVMVGPDVVWQGPWRDSQFRARLDADSAAQRIYYRRGGNGVYRRRAIGATWPVERC